MISTKVPKTAEELYLMYNPLPTYVQPDLVSEDGRIENILTVIASSLEEFKQTNSRSPVEVKISETIAEMETSSPSDPAVTAPPAASLPSQQIPSEPQQQQQQDEEGKQVPDLPLESSPEVEEEGARAESQAKPLPVSVPTAPPPSPWSTVWVKVLGVIVVARVVSSFVGIGPGPGPPSFPLLRALFPSFFTWTLRWRANMNRL
jgi:hypothetical protein